jgi:hypothetical protein
MHNTIPLGVTEVSMVACVDGYRWNCSHGLWHTKEKLYPMTMRTGVSRLGRSWKKDFSSIDDDSALRIM